MRRQGTIRPRTLKAGGKVYDAAVTLTVRETDGQRRKRKLWKRGFKTQKAAQAWINATVGAVANDSWVPRTDATFPEYLADWVEKRGGIKERTRAGYADQVRLYVEPTMRHVKLTHVETDTLRAMFRAIACANHAPKPHKCAAGRVSPATVQRVYSLVHAALVTAQEEGLVARNPATKALRRELARPERVEPRPWTLAELRRFLEAVQGDDLFALWRLAAATGARRSELLGLRWEDVDFDKSEIRVRQTLTTVRGIPTFGTPKSEKSRRTVALDGETLRVLRRHKASQSRHRVALGKAWRGEDRDLVFTQADGAYWHPDVISERFRELVRAARLRKVRFHDIRHGHVSIAAASGEDLFTVSRRVGHFSTAFTTSTYGHLFDETNKKAADAMGAALDGK